MSNEESNESGLVQRLSPKLSGKQRSHLRGLAHALKPIVLVGHKGVTEALIENLDAALLAHELVKVKVHEGDDIEEVATRLAKDSSAQLAQMIGHVLVYYRAHPKQPKIELPKK
ncbi:MAG: ribosome assembly RNA-binding protein YhbY [Bradymonadaceae bacterium]|nr:ribosome assembly RNA-binding protein YhbY [Lujinxingiaceae bacterium]